MSAAYPKQFIQRLGAEAGAYLRNHFYTFKNTVLREAGGLASNVELELEDILQRRIKQAYPNHHIVFIGQADAAVEGHEWVWVVDALDGSHHYSRGNPLYTCNIALQHQGQTVLSVVHQPQTRQLFFAEAGGGAYLNGLETKVSTEVDLARAYAYVELPEIAVHAAPHPEFATALAVVNRLVQQVAQVETFRIGAYGQCLVAAGCFDAYIDLSGTSRALAQAASLLVVREAGGEVFEFKSQAAGAIQVVATNGRLTAALRSLLGT